MILETKEILNVWRKFINEGDANDPGQLEDPDLPSPEGDPVPYDEDLLQDLEPSNNQYIEDDLNA